MSKPRGLVDMLSWRQSPLAGEASSVLQIGDIGGGRWAAASTLSQARQRYSPRGNCNG